MTTALVVRPFVVTPSVFAAKVLLEMVIVLSKSAANSTAVARPPKSLPIKLTESEPAVTSIPTDAALVDKRVTSLIETLSALTVIAVSAPTDSNLTPWRVTPEFAILRVPVTLAALSVPEPIRVTSCGRETPVNEVVEPSARAMTALATDSVATAVIALLKDV